MMRQTLLLVLGTALLAACVLVTPPTPTTAPTQPAPTIAPTEPAPTVAPTEGHLPNVDWLAYHSDLGWFTIQHPLTWQQSDNGGDPVEFVLPAAPGTTLLEKFMDIDVTPNATDCRELRYSGDNTTSENISVNGVNFLKETGAGLGAGNVYEWTGYSTLKGTTCISITFVLHSANPGVYSTAPPDFDEAAESAIFDEILNTFKFDQ
jgi:hypothetical protein